MFLLVITSITTTTTTTTTTTATIIIIIIVIIIIIIIITTPQAALASTRLSHRWNRNPRPQPHKFSKLVFLIKFSESYICLNWLSGVLVGVGGSGFIGNSVRCRGVHARRRALCLQPVVASYRLRIGSFHACSFSFVLTCQPRMHLSCTGFTMISTATFQKSTKQVVMVYSNHAVICSFQVNSER